MIEWGFAPCGLDLNANEAAAHLSDEVELGRVKERLANDRLIECQPLDRGRFAEIALDSRMHLMKLCERV
jgi:hypothetical protein